MNKVYIAGAIKGLPTHLVRAKFEKAEQEIMNAGKQPVNPFERIASINKDRVERGADPLSDDNPNDRKVIMKECLWLLSKSDEIYLLHDWQNSEGATFEKTTADYVGITVFQCSPQ